MPDHQARPAGDLRHRPLQERQHRRDHRRQGRAVERPVVDPLAGQQRPDEHGVLVRGLVGVGGDAEVDGQRVAVEHAELDLGVAAVHGQESGRFGHDGLLMNAGITLHHARRPVNSSGLGVRGSFPPCGHRTSDNWISRPPAASSATARSQYLAHGSSARYLRAGRCGDSAGRVRRTRPTARREVAPVRRTGAVKLGRNRWEFDMSLPRREALGKLRHRAEGAGRVRRTRPQAALVPADPP